ncbi:hypothetical protein D477_010566 [Arthrobacter crystallopoietes BAB-32]|uniref:DUF3040 domain-containing protein n=1 Tax=Arthrobacter crystallopoietes BAB-32 TaxID=1246476 RepID=N1V2S4_9MICC|nr:DUF3040 domain-containing protein [Arthrobacter crystallopoietes]EMY34279.1 hypothetical protein D477_010566 [Arthrobacter crystallopoietes BAB-32]
MQLSDYEREQLQLLEQQLRIEAPELVQVLAAPAALPHRSRLLGGWLLAFCGAIAIVLGAYASLVPLASIGLLGIAAGMFIATSPEMAPAGSGPAG